MAWKVILFGPAGQNLESTQAYGGIIRTVPAGILRLTTVWIINPWHIITDGEYHVGRK